MKAFAVFTALLFVLCVPHDIQAGCRRGNCESACSKPVREKVTKTVKKVIVRR